MSSPVLSWELSQKCRKGKNHPVGLGECLDAAKRKFRPGEIFLKTNGEVYWEQVETDERNLSVGRRMVGEERAGLDRATLVCMS